MEQNAIINPILNKKAIILIVKNNQKAVQEAVTKKLYMHVFTSSKMALLKKIQN